MTREETLKHYKENICKHCCEWKPELRHCENCPTAVAKKSIYRRIPSAPYLFGSGYTSGRTVIWDMWVCPGCAKSYSMDKKYSYCPNCGQAIDWGDVDD